jgi:HPt (histidine-containing phosphotransfer) domain-containing protein
MTAGVLPDDRERCRAAGMDDHVGKPFSPAELQRALERWLPAEAPEEAPPVPLDGDFLASLKALDDGAGRILAEVGSTFLRSAPRRLLELRAALEAGDAPVFQRLAHGLRGICGNVGARRLAGRAAQLEELGRSGDLSGVQPALDELARELQRTCDALRVELG